MFLKYCRECGLPGVACNVSMTYGPEDNQPTPHGWLMAIIAFGQFPCYWDADFSSVGIQDAADALVLAEDKGRVGERYLITEKTLKLKEIVIIAKQRVGLNDRLYKIPIPIMYAICWTAERLAWLARKETRFSVQGLRCSFKVKDFDNSKALKELGWQPRPVQEAIAEAAQWLLTEKGGTEDLSVRLFERA